MTGAQDAPAEFCVLFIHPAYFWFDRRGGEAYPHRMHPRPYEELKVWQLAHQLNLDVSALSRTFPRHERFELTGQLRRAVRSVPTNFAEGHQYGPRVFLRHVRIAQGSLAEVDYLLMNARDEGYVKREVWEKFAERVWDLRAMLIALARSLERAA